MQSKGLSRVFSNTTLQKHQFFSAQSSSQSNSHPYMTTGKIIALTRQTFVCKVMSLLLNILSRLVITFLPRSKHLLISWLQSPSAVSGTINTKICGSELPRKCSNLLSFWFQPHKGGFDPGQILPTCGSGCLSLGSFSITMFYDSGITYCMHDHISRLSKLHLMPLPAPVSLSLPAQNFL